jgi:hypothetical protein
MYAKEPREFDVQLIIEPGRRVLWSEFTTTHPTHSIALDGYCVGPTTFSLTAAGIYLNLNHHEGGEAEAVRATCMQALHWVEAGMYEEVFRLQDVPYARLYAADPDQDVALATFVLLHPSLVRRPLMEPLVVLEDRLDTCAGLYAPHRDKKPLMRAIAWMFEPYTEFRTQGAVISELSADQMGEAIEEMHRRINLYLLGRGEELPLDKRFETIAEYDGWTMVRETGAQARTGMAERGIRAFVSLKSETADGRFHYGIGRGPCARFQPSILYSALNEAEGIAPDSVHRWGGSTNRGGSPIQGGSRLNPDEVGRIIDERVRQWRLETGLE